MAVTTSSKIMSAGSKEFGQVAPTVPSGIFFHSPIKDTRVDSLDFYHFPIVIYIIWQKNSQIRWALTLKYKRLRISASIHNTLTPYPFASSSPPARSRRFSPGAGMIRSIVVLPVDHPTIRATVAAVSFYFSGNHRCFELEWSEGGTTEE